MPPDMRTAPDARTLGAAAQQLLRRQVVQAVRGGMTQTAAARTYGASLRAVSNWVQLDRRGGLLNEKRAARIRALIVGRMPDQLKLPFYLWTRAAVAALIRRAYGLEVSLVTVGRYLKAWGMSPQKPVRRAYERKDAGRVKFSV
jgi:transposase